MTSTGMWIMFGITLWGGSCWYSYKMGYLHGGADANIKAALHFPASKHP